WDHLYGDAHALPLRLRRNRGRQSRPHAAVVDVASRSAERRLQQRRRDVPWRTASSQRHARRVPSRGDAPSRSPAEHPTARNTRPAGRVDDSASSSITVAPDGSLLYGALTFYDFTRGHLVKFSAGGQFLGSYSFGWDSTPAIYQHDATYSIVIKDNEYGGPNF